MQYIDNLGILGTNMKYSSEYQDLMNIASQILSLFIRNRSINKSIIPCKF